MGSTERPKKRAHLCKKAILHFSLCFFMGFFTGFAPTATTKSSISAALSNTTKLLSPHKTSNFSRNQAAEPPPPPPARKRRDQEELAKKILPPRRQLIIVTPTSSSDRFREVGLRRLGNTIRLVRQPLLWIVVEAKRDSSNVAEIMRKTGIMYRHLVFKENFTDSEAEMNHQRNVALKHIEHHRLSGIVHFAGLSNFYDLRFFDELREIEVFGTWPMALVTANKKKVVIEGPVCDSSQVIGWHLKKMANQTLPKPQIHISSFAFNSSILWDPERWGRTSSVQDTSQSVNFVKQVVLEDEAKLTGIPSGDCSKIMLWSLRTSSKTPPANQQMPPVDDVSQIPSQQGT
ncbi:beta-1,4-xylosyltransferase IRX9 isoform X2 [Benincasa hispida]|uniref:beta-1,4-xylosyltransferase IRX9 isoform X2 n=1 Tax=Benincasa hispida TaxID=102211 RepID=UPI0018FFEB2B|nr:beta-1,4-xylosyltransferase IRX9 isoform X2 [Benincasa hispida]